MEGEIDARVAAMHVPSASPPSPANGLILIVEDEPEIADILSAYLARGGFRTALAADGTRALELHLSLRPDLVLLDVQLPRLDGWNVLSGIRQRGDTPVIMLTALDQDVDKLTGLRIGADDYVVKPFNPAEVVARVQAVLRRARGSAERADILRLGAFEIDLQTHEVAVTVDGRRHLPTLTLTEFRLLAQLARTPRRVFSRSELLAACLPDGDALERTVDSHISKLRRKLENLGVGEAVTSVRGVGYRFEPGP